MILNDLNTDLIKEILDALEGLTYGSVEFIVQDGKITQVSTRSIKKTRIPAKLNLKNRLSVNS